MIIGWVICGKHGMSPHTQVWKTEEDARKEYLNHKEYYDKCCPAPVVIVPEEKRKVWGGFITRRLWDLAIDVT